MRLAGAMRIAGSPDAGGILIFSLLLSAALATAQSAGPDDEAASGLELVNLSLLDSRDGFAIPANSRFLPGEPVHVYCQVRGYGVGDLDRVSLQYELRALDPDGRRFFMAEGGKIDVKLAPQDKDWMPVVRYSPRIPDHAGGGTYWIHIEVHDEIAQASISVRVPVEVEGERVQSSGELLVRNFQFVDSETGDPVPDAVFSQGGYIRAEFFITGYEMEADNSFQVESEAWVVDSRGRRMYEFERRGETGSPYYPRMWLPGFVEFDLDQEIPAGQYEVVLRLFDLVGGVETSQRYRFRIRRAGAL